MISLKIHDHNIQEDSFFNVQYFGTAVFSYSTLTQDRNYGGRWTENRSIPSMNVKVSPRENETEKNVRIYIYMYSVYKTFEMVLKREAKLTCQFLSIQKQPYPK